jgi:hypothetical protein
MQDILENLKKDLARIGDACTTIGVTAEELSKLREAINGNKPEDLIDNESQGVKVPIPARVLVAYKSNQLGAAQEDLSQACNSLWQTLADLVLAVEIKDPLEDAVAKALEPPPAEVKFSLPTRTPPNADQ